MIFRQNFGVFSSGEDVRSCDACAKEFAREFVSRSQTRLNLYVYESDLHDRNDSCAKRAVGLHKSTVGLHKSIKTQFEFKRKVTINSGQTETNQRRKNR